MERNDEHDTCSGRVFSVIHDHGQMAIGCHHAWMGRNERFLCLTGVIVTATSVSNVRQPRREPRPYILRCTHPDAATWRAEFRTDLTDFHRRTQTAPEFDRLLTTALNEWFHTTSEDVQVDPIPFSDKLCNLIIEQNAIGWRQIFSGRFSKEWSVVQQAQYHRLRSNQQANQRKRTGDRWQAQLIVTIWKAWDKRWAARNKAVHGHDTTTRQ